MRSAEYHLVYEKMVWGNRWVLRATDWRPGFGPIVESSIYSSKATSVWVAKQFLVRMFNSHEQRSLLYVHLKDKAGCATARLHHVPPIVAKKEKGGRQS